MPLSKNHRLTPFTWYEVTVDTIHLGDAMSQEGISVWGNPKGIDLYGWGTAHEIKHRNQIKLTWGWGANCPDLSIDADNDYLRYDGNTLDDENQYMPQRPYLPGDDKTYTDSIGYSSGTETHIYDFEDTCMREQTPPYDLDVLWNNGDADDEDWANPGKNSKTKY